jgi:hypothetical protein
VLKRIQRHSQRASTRRLQVGDGTLPQSTATKPQSLSERLGDNGSSSPSRHRAALSTKKRKATTPNQTSRKKQSDSPSGRVTAAASAAAQVIWSGAPDEKLPGGWPKGWIKKIYNRSRGPRIDRYWYSPKLELKLRSLVEVKRFLSALEECSGDEQAAFQIARQK